MKSKLILYCLIVICLVISTLALVRTYHPGTHYVIQKTSSTFGTDGYKLEEIP